MYVFVISFVWTFVVLQDTQIKRILRKKISMHDWIWSRNQPLSKRRLLPLRKMNLLKVIKNHQLTYLIYKINTWSYQVNIIFMYCNFSLHFRLLDQCRYFLTAIIVENKSKIVFFIWWEHILIVICALTYTNFWEASTACQQGTFTTSYTWSHFWLEVLAKKPINN